MNNFTKSRLRLWVTVFVPVIFWAGCAVKKMELTESGFLSGYSGMVEDEQYEGMLVYRNPDVNLEATYNKVLIAPLQFKLDPDEKTQHLDYEDRLKLSNYFHEKLIEGLIDDYEIVDEPGVDVLLVRSAVTDVLPNKVYLNVHWSTTLLGGGIGGAALEAEFVDSLTNEQVLAFTDARKGKTALNQPKHLIKNYKSGLTKWGNTKEVLGKWAEIMVEHLKEMRDGTLVETVEADTVE